MPVDAKEPALVPTVSFASGDGSSVIAALKFCMASTTFGKQDMAAQENGIGEDPEECQQPTPFQGIKRQRF